MTYQTIEVEIEGAVACITLNRPDQANAMNPLMAAELLDAAIAFDEDSAVRAVLLGARGKMFCAGGDLAHFVEAGDRIATVLKKMTVDLHAAISRFNRMRAPLVAAIGGTAAGAGFSLACASDLAVAAASARFVMAYTRAGLTPDGSSTYFLPRIVGRRRALELMLTNRTLSAREAADWGIVNQVVADDQVDQVARELAVQLAAGPTSAFGAVKELVLRSETESLESQMEHEARAISAATHGHDAREGMQAFFEKRPPAFVGR